MTYSLACEILSAVGNLKDNEIAELKKSFGRKFSQASIKAYMAYKKVVKNLVSKKEDEIVFPVIAMFVFCGKELYGKTPFSRAARLVTKENDKEFLRIVKDIPSDDTLMLYRIASLCSRAKREGIEIDFASMMTDLCNWVKDENETIKRKWIQQYVEN